MLVALAAVSAHPPCRDPIWPTEFAWSSNGPKDGETCVRIIEPSDSNTWKNNYFCHKTGPGIQGIGMKWSHKGKRFNTLCVK